MLEKRGLVPFTGADAALALAPDLERGLALDEGVARREDARDRLAHRVRRVLGAVEAIAA